MLRAQLRTTSPSSAQRTHQRLRGFLEGLLTHVQRSPELHANTGEGERVHLPVPRPGSNAPRRRHPHGHDGNAALRGQVEHALLQYPSRASWAIRRHGRRVPAFEVGHYFVRRIPSAVSRRSENEPFDSHPPYDYTNRTHPPRWVLHPHVWSMQETRMEPGSRCLKCEGKQLVPVAEDVVHMGRQPLDAHVIHLHAHTLHNEIRVPQAAHEPSVRSDGKAGDQGSTSDSRGSTQGTLRSRQQRSRCLTGPASDSETPGSRAPPCPAGAGAARRVFSRLDRRPTP